MNMKNNTNFWGKLPIEIKYIILKYLSNRDLHILLSSN
ncbi:MPPV-316 ankyrin repeat protein [Magpiepox virus 2]|nr:MPPV-316 ankyrin repeat protein [Magpiepox virus 2]